MTVYNAAHHQQAFELYFQTRSFNKVSTQLELTYSTIFRWSEKDFPCKFGCPYHNWKALIEERERVSKAQIQLIQDRDFDPITSDAAIRQAIDNPNRLAPFNPEAHPTSHAVYRPDLERLAHWEYLYGKVFFDLTGMALDYAHVKRDVSVSIEQVYAKGMRIQSAEAALRSLAIIEDHITAIRQRLCMIKADGEDGDFPWAKTMTQMSADPAQKVRTQLTLDELRALRSKPVTVDVPANNSEQRTIES